MRPAVADDDSAIRFKVPDARPEQEVCDFCGAPNPTWDYPAADFDFTTPLVDGGKVVQRSTGSWGACEACSACIERDDYEALAQRSGAMQMFRNLPAEVRTAKVEARMLANTKAHYAHFRVNRTGPRVSE